MKTPFRVLFGSLLLAVLTIFPAHAYALSLQDILVMAQQGVPDSVIISVIESAGELPALTKEDYDAMKKAGISKRISAALSARRKQAGNKTPQDNPPKNILNPSPSPSPSPEFLPADAQKAAQKNEPPVPAPLTGIPEIPGALPPVPMETSNALLVWRKFFEETFKTYAVEAEMARQYDALKTAAEQERAFGADLPEVESWRALIQKGSPERALDACMARLEEKQPHPDTSLAAALNLCIGQALDAMDAPALAAVYLAHALESRATVHNYPSVFRRFKEMARTILVNFSAKDMFTHEDDIPKSDRDEFRYFVALHEFLNSRQDENAAIKMLENITGNSITHARALILKASIFARPSALRFKSAADALSKTANILHAVKHADKNTRTELLATANLALARIAFENHAFNIADYFYRQVGISSRHIGDALYEGAWNSIFSARYADAISQTHALRAPQFQNFWRPDILLIDALALLGLCQYDLASHALEILRANDIADAGALRDWLASTTPDSIYQKTRDHAENPDNSKLPDRVFHRVIGDAAFRDLHRNLKKLSDESERFGRNHAHLVAWPKIQTQYADAIAARRKEIATRLAATYESALAELHALDISASEVAIEIRLAQRKREAECLKIAAAGGQCKKNTPAATARIEKSSGDIFWSFDGEFWRDEIRTYVTALPSLCSQ